MKQMTARYWLNYIKVNTNANKTAARQMERYIATYGTDDMDRLATFAYGLVSKYGEASAALSCEVYESTARAQGVSIPDAEPAETASFEEVSKAVRGAAKRSPQMIPDTVGRLVKQAGADTTLKNALRDGAYFAWVPHGDTCAFCCMLAGNDWQKASKKTIKGEHAEHIHANCDCEFAVSFNGPGKIEGYDPGKYRAMYDNAEGNNWQEKLNSLRRQQYAANPEKYRRQSREAYAKRTSIASEESQYKEMLRRRIGKQGQEIIDKPTYNKLTENFRRRGGIIIRGEEAEKHLANSGAYASYLPGANIAFIRDEATVSDVLEEMYHAEQDKKHLYGEHADRRVVLLREIDAKKYLQRVAKRYKIPIAEQEETQKLLEIYERKLEKIKED